MELSWEQNHLINGLLLMNVEEEAIPGIVMCLPEKEQLYAMMDWMCENMDAGTAEVLEKTAELAR